MWTASKESETSALQSLGTESCQHLTEQGNGLSRTMERDTALLTPWCSSSEMCAGLFRPGLLRPFDTSGTGDYCTRVSQKGVQYFVHLYVATSLMKEDIYCISLVRVNDMLRKAAVIEPCCPFPYRSIKHILKPEKQDISHFTYSTGKVCFMTNNVQGIVPQPSSYPPYL